MAIVLFQPTDGTVSDLAYTFPLQIQILSNLGHRFMLTVDAKEAVDDLRLTLIK